MNAETNRICKQLNDGVSAKTFHISFQAFVGFSKIFLTIVSAYNSMDGQEFPLMKLLVL